MFEEGPPAALIASDKVRKVYLGDSFAPLPNIKKPNKNLKEGLGAEEKKALDE